MKKFITKPILGLTIVALVTGFLLMAAFRYYNINVSRAAEPRNQHLISYIQNLEEEIGQLEEEVLDIRGQIKEIQRAQTEGETMLVGMNKNLEVLKDYAGLTEAKGSGIILTIDDNHVGAELAKKNSPETYYPENYIVHSTDILYLIKSASGQAEGVSVNNQRVVDTSNIRCVGTVVLVNSARLAPPYEIRMIGDPAALETAITESYHYSVLKAKEMPLKIEQAEEQVLPAYLGSYDTHYSQLPKDKTEDAPQGDA